MLGLVTLANAQVGLDQTRKGEGVVTNRLQRFFKGARG